MRPIAILPARGGSKRIPRKNIVPVGGKPMIVWAIETAKASGLFGRVVVSTEDEEIAAIARGAGAEVLARPPELATDTAAETDAYAQVLEVLEARTGERPPYFCGIYPTALLLEPRDLRDAFARFGEGADVVMGVSEYPIHRFKALQAGPTGYLAPVYPVQNDWRSQDYPMDVASNGTFYWFRTDAFLANRTYYPERLLGYVVPRERAVDLDTPADLRFAELLLRMKRERGLAPA